MRAQIFKEWCLLAHNLISAKMTVQADRADVFRELAKNFGEGFEPQETDFSEKIESQGKPIFEL